MTVQQLAVFVCIAAVGLIWAKFRNGYTCMICGTQTGAHGDRCPFKRQR